MAFESIPTLEGAAQEAHQKVAKALEDGVPIGGPSDSCWAIVLC